MKDSCIYRSTPTEEVSFALSLFNRANDNDPRHRDFTWASLLDMLAGPLPIVADKSSLPAFSPARFREGTTRSGRNVEEIALLVFDLDNVTDEELRRVHGRLERLGLAHVIHSTYGHGEAYKKGKKGKFRVIVLLSRPVVAAEWASFWRRAWGSLAPEADVQCKDAARMYYLPGVPPGAEDSYGLLVFPGGPLDVNHVLSEWPDPEPGKVESLATSEARKCRKHTLRDLRELARQSKGQWQEMTKRAAEGESMVAARGETTYDPNKPVHNRLVSYFAWLSTRWPDADPSDIVALFAPSMQALGTIDRNLGNDVYDIEVVGEWFVSAQLKYAWAAQLTRTKGGKPHGCVANAIMILRGHPDVRGILAYDERRAVATKVGSLPWSDGTGDVTDRDASLMCVWLARETGGIFSSKTCMEAILTVAKDHTFDPVRAYLERLEWDGVERLEGWLSQYAGATDTRFVEAVGIRWMIAAVARALAPGCKVDTMLVLEGPQGARKSTLLRVLVGDDFFKDDLVGVEGKDAKIGLLGAWLIEFAELGAYTRKADVEKLKAFISSATDRFRPLYGLVEGTFPRRCVFAATVNDDGAGYLRDVTGGRRFWPIRVGTIDIEGLTKDRDQLWAEAVALYRAGERWWLEGEEEVLAAEEQENRRENDPWEKPIRDYLATGKTLHRPSSDCTAPVEVTAEDVLKKVIDMPVKNQEPRHRSRVGRILTKYCGQSRRRRVNGRQVKFYTYQPADDESGVSGV